MSVFSATVFDPDVFAVDAPVSQQTQGLLMDTRRLRAVPFRGPETGARVISPAAIRRARRKFQDTEDEWLLGVLADAEWMEVA